MDPSDRISLFRDLISCINPINSWSYSDSGELLYSNINDMERSHLFQKVFSMANVFSTLYEHLKNENRPVVVSINAGLIWAAAFQSSENGTIIHVLGPVFGAEASLEEVRRALRPWENTITENREGMYRYMRAINELPVVSFTEMSHYAVMLHFCLAGEKLSVSDVILRRSSYNPENAKLPLAHEDRHRHWMAEEALLHTVREGDLNYMKTLDRTFAIKNLWAESSGTPLEREILNQIIQTVLSSRAAVEGGLSADTAYHLANSYIKTLQGSKTISDARATGLNMYGDFVRRVYNNRTNGNCSDIVKHCRDYITLHVEEDLSIAAIAGQLGYTPYYFARRFKAETGTSLPRAIRIAKLEHSKYYLVSTDLSIQEIAEKLHFSSRTRYSDAFSAFAGMSPAAWRKEHRHR